MRQSEGAGPVATGHGPGYEQRGQRLLNPKITAEARDTQAERREALRSAVKRIRRRFGAGAVRIAVDLLAEADGR
jgi:hypothetical protein